MPYERITNAQAKKLFNAGKPIWLCPCKCYPSNPWNLACMISSAEWIEQAKLFNGMDNKPMDDKSVQFRAWGSMLANWNYYNANHELGYYPHYYVQQ